MNLESDENIIKMLCSLEGRERNIGAKAFIKKYESKVKSWIKKQSIKTDPDDVWQDAASLMIFAIQSGKYKKYEAVELYTYFHWIVKSSWMKATKNQTFNVSLSENYDFVEQNHDEYKPDIFTELNQNKSFVQDCLAKLDPQTRQLLMEIIVEDASLKEIFETFGLKNYNNAKQKFFKSKKALISCLKKHLGYGK